MHFLGAGSTVRVRGGDAIVALDQFFYFAWQLVWGQVWC